MFAVLCMLLLLRPLLRQYIHVELLHDLNHQLEAVHEGVDGHAEHPVGRGAVVDLQHPRPVCAVCAVAAGCFEEGEVPAHER